MTILLTMVNCTLTGKTNMVLLLILGQNKNLFVCPLPTYSPKIGPTQKNLLPFQFFIFFFQMFLSEDKLFSLEINVFSFKP